MGLVCLVVGRRHTLAATGDRTKSTLPYRAHQHGLLPSQLPLTIITMIIYGEKKKICSIGHYDKAPGRYRPVVLFGFHPLDASPPAICLVPGEAQLHDVRKGTRGTPAGDIGRLGSQLHLHPPKRPRGREGNVCRAKSGAVSGSQILRLVLDMYMGVHDLMSNPNGFIANIRFLITSIGLLLPSLMFPIASSLKKKHLGSSSSSSSLSLFARELHSPDRHISKAH